MGKKDKEHKKKVRARNLALSNPITRKMVAVASRKGVLTELYKAPTNDQISVLDSQVGEKNPSKLRDAIMKNAPKEMDKAIEKYRKQGKIITVDSLCEEIRQNVGFLAMCERVGLSLGWFEKLAADRMVVNGIKEA